MPTIQTANTVLDRHYLEMRCSLLDLAAAFDRIARSDNAAVVAQDSRLKLLRQAIDIIASEGTDRAERLQILFSDPYVEGWNRK
ncbi:hypothetical protein [Planctomicrobium piriforme]|uniref:Uncharacterized protein n=1 Tax=Planctomicrobium piriforme TaxID=1576369 RepID=A0A1I3KQ31_9PLAN|nr:hypothetical protein [Planctomicrobium piriforme]SFI74474.1 hypothetical protein SAMN05421753_1125 [Planctomicrobium piriforme]